MRYRSWYMRGAQRLGRYRAKAMRYAWRGGSRGYGRSKFGLNLSTPFLAGAAVGGLTAFDNNIDVRLKILAATAPIRGFGAIKAFAQGLLFGDALQSYTGFGGIGGGGAQVGGNI